MHGTFSTTSIQIEPAILYFGTPVVLIGTCNEDGSQNLAPMSSAWWIGWRCMLGLDPTSKTTENLIRSGECVLNLPSADLVGAVDRLARTTGTDPVPAGKVKRGYRHAKEKFDLSGLTALGGDTVAAPRALECPVQLEAKLAHVHELAQDEKVWRGARAIEVRITRVHAHPRHRDGRRSQPDRSGQVAPADHELCAVLRPDAGEAAALRTRPDSGALLQAAGLAAGSLTTLRAIPASPPCAGLR
jgi:flavin reductase (DIM6/NTAB) family NADH-FMN oxidoreductase RutF